MPAPSPGAALLLARGHRPDAARLCGPTRCGSRGSTGARDRDHDRAGGSGSSRTARYWRAPRSWMWPERSARPASRRMSTGRHQPKMAHHRGRTRFHVGRRPSPAADCRAILRRRAHPRAVPRSRPTPVRARREPSACRDTPRCRQCRSCARLQVGLGHRQPLPKHRECPLAGLLAGLPAVRTGHGANCTRPDPRNHAESDKSVVSIAERQPIPDWLFVCGSDTPPLQRRVDQFGVGCHPNTDRQDGRLHVAQFRRADVE